MTPLWKFRKSFIWNNLQKTAKLQNATLMIEGVQIENDEMGMSSLSTQIIAWEKSTKKRVQNAG